LVLDGEDQVARLERFRAAHPEIVILLLDAWPKAWLNGQKIEHPTLRGLLDLVQTAADDGGEVTESFDAADGHPVKVSFDVSGDGEAECFAVSDYAATP